MVEELALEERTQAERHDNLYGFSRPADLVMKPNDWEKFDSHETPIDPYFSTVKKLGDVAGRNLLDAGCGDGWLSVILARRGATVDGFDISEQGIRVAEVRAKENGAADRCVFKTASFYDLPYPNERFDRVAGVAILHHVTDKERVATELHRVMKPGAVAVFLEPFGNSLWLERLRNLVPVKSVAEDDPTEWKRQFKYRDLDPFRPLFDISVTEWEFFSRLDRVIRSARFTNSLRRVDRSLLRWFPWLRPYARAIVIEMTRPKR